MHEPFINREQLDRCIMMPEQLSLVKQGICPKCYRQFALVRSCGDMKFSKCTCDVDIWITEEKLDV